MIGLAALNGLDGDRFVEVLAGIFEHSPWIPAAVYGQKPFASVREPARTELIGEVSGGIGLSSHDRRQPLQFPDARNVMSFVDGHVDYIKIFWNGVQGGDGFPGNCEPPAGYDYKWSGN